MSKWRFFVFCFSIVVLQVNGHNYGAPQAACDTMIPRHTPNIQQEGASRHSFTTSKTIVKGGESIQLELKGFTDKEQFAGFFIMARDEKTNMSIGEFLVEDCDTCKAKTVDCHSNKKSAVTHMDNSNKSSVALKWKAPINYTNNTEFKFYYTIVRNYTTFWVKEASGPLVWISHATAVTSSNWLMLIGSATFIIIRTTF